MFLQGWRVVFFGMAGVATAATLTVLFGGIEPRNLKPKLAEEAGLQRKSLLQTLLAGIRLIISNTAAVFRVRTFLIILAAGVVGSISITGYSYKTLYFQARAPVC